LWDYTSWQWDLNQAILDRFEELAATQPFRKAIVFTPGTGDLPGDKDRRLWLKQYAARHATPFLDLSDAIHRLGDKPFIHRDPHYNPLGHQVVAQDLDRFLSESGLLESR
jgi:hypothetical protein